MIQLTFIGTGAAFSTRQRTNVAILVRDIETQILLECGPTILYQLECAGSSADRIRHLFVSHRHGDHILGIPMFLLKRSLGGTDGPLSLFGTREVIQTSKALIRNVYPELTQHLTNLSWVELAAERVSSTKLEPSITLSTLPVSHSYNVTTLASRLDFERSGRSLVYTGDMSYSEELAEFAAGCDLLVHEANFCETLEPDINPDTHGGHSTALQAGWTAARAGCKILALVHLNPSYTGREDAVRAEAAQEFAGQIIIPRDSATIYL